jgi:DNA-binding response OmpR family regulator
MCQEGSGVMTKRILIIDDDTELCEELSLILQDQGYLADLAYDGQTGEQMIDSNLYNAVILDFKLPGEDGGEVLKRIKAKLPDLPVFMISGRPQLEKYLEEENLARLVFMVMTKPFDVELLLNNLKLL